MPFSILLALAAWEGDCALGRFSGLYPTRARACLAALPAGAGRWQPAAQYRRHPARSGARACWPGVILATLTGYLLAKSRLLERLLSPYLVASQAIPIVAIAPLLVIWFGPGMFSKILICALIVFFPVLVNTVVGVRAVPENLRDLMRSMHATPLQMLRYLEIPAALPVFLGGLRIGATLSVIGAVVGEFVGADRGLGFLINVGRGQYDTALVFVAVFTLVAMALGSVRPGPAA